jgi:hypothetical protein
MTRRRTPLYVLSFMMAACGTGFGGEDDAPRVDDVTPRQGDYGTTVTVTGRNLEGASIAARAPDGESIEVFKTPPKSTSTKAPPLGPIAFRFPFPADGEMTLRLGARDIALGSFTPSLTPGLPATFEQGSRVLGAAIIGDATVAFAETPARVGFYVFAAGEPLFVPVEPQLTQIQSVAVRTDGDRMEALVEANGELHRVTFDGTATRATKYDSPAGSVLGIGADARGFVVVVQTAEGISRMRGEPPLLVADGAAVALPSSSKFQAMAVSADGTVIRAWAGSGGSFLDTTASFSMSGLAPDATAWGPSVNLAVLDDDATSLSAAVQGGVVVFSYCAIDTGFFESRKTHCGSSFTVDGRTELSSSGSDTAIEIESGRVTFAKCGQEGNVILETEGTASSESVPLYPCTGVRAFARSSAGPRLLVERSGKLWAPRKR